MSFVKFVLGILVCCVLSKTPSENFRSLIDRAVPYFQGEKNIGDYDVVVSIDTMLVLNGDSEKNKWSIEYSNETFYKEMVDSRSSVPVISFVGTFNSGKTWAINQLCSEKLYSDYTYRTKGLSVKFPLIEDEYVAYLDTAGVQTSIEFAKLGAESNHDIVTLIQDRIAVEQFSLDFLVESAFVIVVVVNQLTYQDQQMIGRIETLIPMLGFDRYSDHERRIIILHNIKEVTTEEDMEKKIQEDIIDVFGAEKREECVEQIGGVCKHRGIFYMTKNEKGKTKYLHFVTGDGTKMKDFNRKTLETMRKFMKKSSLPPSAPRHFDIVKEFEEYTKRKLSDFIKCGDQQYEVVRNSDGIYLNDCSDFEPKVIMQDALGNIMYGYSKTDFTPVYDLFYEPEGIRILMDMPGDYKNIDCRLENTFNKNAFLHFSGERLVDNVGNKKAHSGTRKFGHFSIVVGIRGKKLDSTMIPSTISDEKIRKKCVCHMNMKDGVMEIFSYNQEWCMKSGSGRPNFFIDEL